ncbi:amidophosphoribosyltransferase, partial [Candidatus Woesearchaeota archaeon]|nr:amidophosphoribosyltransferase [Candidatus Woesearchaeota archaeon]
MSEPLRHNCGVAAVSLKNKDENNALFYLYRILLNLQNRGQLSAGITTYNAKRPQLLDTYRNMGT